MYVVCPFNSGCSTFIEYGTDYLAESTDWDRDPLKKNLSDMEVKWGIIGYKMLFLFSILKTEFNIIPALSSSAHTFALGEKIFKKIKMIIFNFTGAIQRKILCIWDQKTRCKW